MKSYLIIGLGKFGASAARKLYSLGQDVMVIDRDVELIEHISDEVTHAVAGDAKDEMVLKTIGVRNFDYVIVAIGSDIQNSVLITVMLKEMGAKYIIAKAQSKLHYRVLTKIGANKVVFPENDMGERLAQRLVSDNVVDYIELSQDYSIAEIEAPRSWIGKEIKQIDVRAKYEMNILAIKSEQRDNDEKDIIISPKADHVIVKGSILVVLGSNKKISEIINL